MADLKAFAEQLVSLTVKEVNELAQILKEEYGIEPAAAATVVAGPAVAASDAEQAEEKSTFDVVIKHAGQSKLAVVKLVKELTSLGLKKQKSLLMQRLRCLKKEYQKTKLKPLKRNSNKQEQKLRLSNFNDFF